MKRMIDEAMDFESNDKNFIFDFKTMSKKYGRAYVDFCRASWQANDGVMSEDEFMKMNGDMPRGFFENTVKK